MELENSLIFKDIPLNTFLKIGQCNNFFLLNKLKDKVIKLSQPSEKTHVKGNFTGFKALQEDSDFYNFLTDIKKDIQKIFSDNFIIKDAWGNVCKKNNLITKHDHRGVDAFCGILYLSEGGPGTYFNDYALNVEEKFGRFVLFHPYLFHEVKKIDSELFRVTIAFNCNHVKNTEYAI